MRDERVAKLVEDGLVQNDPAGGGATLAGGAEGSPENALDSEVEVGVVENDHRVLAAHLERTVLEAAGRDFADHASDFAGTREGDGANVRMREHGRAGFGAESGDDVDHTFRQTGVEQRLNDVDGRERSVFSGLDHAGVSADKRREELPRWDRHGKVPRRDHAAYAHGLADGHREFVGEFGGNRLAEEAAAFAGHVIRG